MTLKRLFIISALAALTVTAQAETDFRLNLESGIESSYVFRGAKIGGPALQFSGELGLEAGPGDLYGGAWTNQDLTGDPATEYNLYAGYSFGLNDFFRLDAGAIFYFYADDDRGLPGTSSPVRMPKREEEIFIGLVADLPFSPSLYVFYNFPFEQVLFEGRAHHTIPLAEQWGLLLGGYLGVGTSGDKFGPREPIDESNSFWYFGINTDVVYTISRNWSASAGLRFSSEQDIAEENLWGGARVSYRF